MEHTFGPGILSGFTSPLDLTYRDWMRPGDAEIVSNF
jgi:hypothetical protein